MTPLNRRSVLGLGAAAGAGLVIPTTAAAANAAPAFIRGNRPSLTHGVQSGDVGARGGVLWSRADKTSRLVAEISADESFRRARPVSGPVVTAKSDFTGELKVDGLEAGRDYFYRVRAVDPDDPRRGSAWELGRLRTAPARRQDIRFLWSGDIAGQGWGANPDFGGFRIAPAMAAREADFFLSSGDNVYADGPLISTVTLPDGRVWNNIVTEEKDKVAETLAEFRGQYAYNLLADNWRAFLAQTPIVAQWDDHEVTNNWYPGEILPDDGRYTERRVDVLAARAKQAFHEYIPVGDASPDPDGRIYRKLSYGPLMDLFVLDMRTHKDTNTTNAETSADGGVLGERQTKWLLRELAASRATWKVIAADMPLGIVVADGAANFEAVAQGDPGAPLGRELQIAELLRHIKHQRITGTLWLTADVHYTAANHYAPERAAFGDFAPFWEFVSGPVGAGGFPAGKLDATFGPETAYVQSAPLANMSPSESPPYYGEVEIDGGSGELTVRLRRQGGGVLFTQSLQPGRVGQ